MSVWDYLLLALVALIAGFAVGLIVHKRKRGGCIGCSACFGNCASCERKSARDEQPDERTKR